MRPRLTTKRQVLGQLTVCNGCCCGDTDRGRPAVPVEWLKEEWRRRGLLKKVQLTISGCLGPCDVPNVVAITTASGTQWFGNITEISEYQCLLAWASRCKEAGVSLPLPTELERYAIDPFAETRSRQGNGS
jgi:predicted metal-binding protein